MQAENERLKETAKIAIQEIRAWSRKAGKLEAENERLKAWILKIKEYARSISVIVVRYCEDVNPPAKENLKHQAGRNKTCEHCKHFRPLWRIQVSKNFLN